MEKTVFICKTDAYFLLEFQFLQNNGFWFKYLKETDEGLREFANCNGLIFGPFDEIYFDSVALETAEWTARNGRTRYHYTKNGEECIIEKLKRNSMNELDQLLDEICRLKKDRKIPEEEYHEHVLRLNRKKQEFFVTNKKKYGPYHHIYQSKYNDEEHFQFTYSKRKKSHRWYYNCNGKEIGPFFGITGPFNIEYDNNNHAVLSCLEDCNCIYIDGKRIKCFNKKYNRCYLFDCKEHEIFMGEDTNRYYHVKKDGIELDFCVRQILVYDDGDIAYSKIEGETETWFYNDKQISLPVNGQDSKIDSTIVSYKKPMFKYMPDIPFFKWNGEEYNGMSVFSKGFVFMENRSIYFLPMLMPFPVGPKLKRHFSAPNCFLHDEYKKITQGNLLKLYYGNLLAGRD